MLIVSVQDFKQKQNRHTHEDQCEASAYQGHDQHKVCRTVIVVLKQLSYRFNKPDHYADKTA
jgi:hypothetical protein